MCAGDPGMSLSPETRFDFAYGSVYGIRFGFRSTVRLRGFDWTFGKALRMQECAIVLGSYSFRES